MAAVVFYYSALSAFKQIKLTNIYLLNLQIPPAFFEKKKKKQDVRKH